MTMSRTIGGSRSLFTNIALCLFSAQFTTKSRSAVDAHANGMATDRTGFGRKSLHACDRRVHIGILGRGLRCCWHFVRPHCCVLTGCMLERNKVRTPVVLNIDTRVLTIVLVKSTSCESELEIRRFRVKEIQIVLHDMHVHALQHRFATRISVDLPVVGSE